MFLKKFVYVNWGNIPALEFDFGPINLFSGGNGSGKTTAADAIQTIMTAAHDSLFHYNPGQDEATQRGRGKNVRTLASYVLGCDDGSYARPGGAVGYLAAVFHPTQGESGEPFNMDDFELTFLEKVWYTISPAIHLENLYYWVRYRTFDKYHVIKTDLKPGYYDKSTQYFHSCFSILVDFVELECAWMEYICCRSDIMGNVLEGETFLQKIKKKIHKRFYRHKRNPEWGLSWIGRYEKWLNDPEEMEKAGEGEIEMYKYHKEWADKVIYLYNWYKNRPNRVDPYEASGMQEFSRRTRGRQHLLKPIKDSDGKVSAYQSCDTLTAEEKEEQSRLYKRWRVIEDRYKNEDIEQLKLLAEVHNGFWT